MENAQALEAGIVTIDLRWGVRQNVDYSGEVPGAESNRVRQANLTRNERGEIGDRIQVPAGWGQGSRSTGTVKRGIAYCLALVAGAIALSISGNLLLALFPVTLQLKQTDSTLAIAVDGQSRTVSLEQPLQSIRFAPANPYAREYQIDGSDTTNNFTFDPAYFAANAASPNYRLQSLLRDEASYSRWQNLLLSDFSGRPMLHQERVGDSAIALPPAFSLTVELHRIEAKRTVELLDEAGNGIQIEVNRNDKHLRIAKTSPSGSSVELSRSYYPTDWKPPLAELAYALLRACAIALLLFVLFIGLVAAMRRGTFSSIGHVRLIVALLSIWVLLFSYFAAVALFDKAPHIMDAVSYYFQGKILAGGALSAPAPPVAEAFPTPFMVIHDGKWFSQYPPGTPLVLALGFLVGLPWLVEPALAALSVWLVFYIGRRQYGPQVGLLATALFASSPFLWLQAGSFLSHVPAMFFALCFLYAATRLTKEPRLSLAVTAAAGLGMAFLSREIVAVIYALAVGLYLIWNANVPQWRRALRPGLVGAIVFGVFLLVYLGYNASLTGSPITLPRTLFNPGDRMGFGAGVGFYGQHTIAGGLVNTDELLTSLNVYLFGWPFYMAMALMVLPYLLRRAKGWDWVHGLVVVLLILVYFAYFYHGIALGPRYYFEALPSFAFLTGRGFSVLVASATALWAEHKRDVIRQRAQLVAVGLAVLLVASNLILFQPRLLTLYKGYSGMPQTGGPTLGDFVHDDIAGRASSLKDALVTTDDWWVYVAYLAAMNCPEPKCNTVFAFAPDGNSTVELSSYFSGRQRYVLRNQSGTLVAEPATGESLPGE